MARQQFGIGWFREKYARQEPMASVVPTGTAAESGSHVLGQVLDLQGAVGVLAAIEVATLSATSIKVTPEISLDQTNWFALEGDTIEATGTLSRAYSTYQGRYLRFRSVVTGGTAAIATPVIASATPEGTGGTLAPGKYRYVVTALDAAGETVASNEVQATVTAGQKVKVKWAEVTGASGGYRVYRSPLNGGPGSENGYQHVVAEATVELVDSGAAGTAGTPLGRLAVPAITSIAASSPTTEEDAEGKAGRLAAGAYKYVVTALNGEGETVASAEQEVTVAASQVVTVKWTKVVGATGGYRVYRTDPGGASGSEEFVLLAPGEATTELVDNGSQLDQSWPPGTIIATPVIASATPEGSGSTLATGTYRYKVTALNAAGQTVGSNEVEAVVTAGQKVKVKWASITGATGGYRVYRSPLNGYPGSENSYQAVAGEGSTELVDEGAAGEVGTVPTTGTSGSPASTIPAKGGTSGADAVLGINVQTVRDRKPGGTNNQ